MNKPVVPCIKTGKDCPKRHIGCHAECSEWAVYEKKQEKYRKFRHLEGEVGNYLESRFTNDRGQR